MKYTLIVSGFRFYHDDLRALQILAYGLSQPCSARDWSIHENMIDGHVDWDKPPIMEKLVEDHTPRALLDAIGW